MNAVIVTGAGGQLGSELRALSAHYPSLTFHFYDRNALPLDDKERVEQTFSSIQPLICINAAAYTAVDKAESEPEAAFAINGTAVGLLAEQCRLHDCLFLHVSTDYVFDGQASRPYEERDAVHPLGVYGASKLLGEQLAAGQHDRVVILRTSWVYSYFGKNFVKTMQRLLKEKESLGVVSDQFGRPTYAADLANALLSIAMAYLALTPAARKADPRFNAIYHYADQGVISWYDLASAIRDILQATCIVRPITTADYPTPAKRPAYSVLDTTRVATAFGLQIPEWQDSLRICLTQLTQTSTLSL